MASDRIRLYITISACLISVACSVTDPGDMKILNDFRNGLENPELLEWPDKGDDPCGPPRWAHVFCSNGRVTQIQAKYLGLKGTLPQSFNQLVKLQNLGLQNNNLSGALPSFSGLSELEYAYLDFNDFDTIPSDFFHGLSSIKTLALDRNPFNASTGWSIPDEAQELVHLTNFSCYDCNIVGPLPAFFGKMPSLTLLTLSSNRLSGHIPASFYQSVLQVLWLNDQAGGGMTGPIDVIGSMVGSAEVWLHGNQFSGTLPNNIGALTSLRELRLNRNQLVGVVPVGMDNLNLQLLDLSNNMLMGPIPKFKAATVTYASNSFCLPDPGEQCSPNVNAFLDFLGAVNFPPNLAFRWTGNDPCKEPWMGITCNTGSQVTRINLQSLKLNGTLSPSLANLDSLLEINLGGNNLSGLVPKNLTELKSLQLLDLSGNNFSPPLPKFRDDVKIIIDGNPQLDQAEPPSPLTGSLPPSPIILPSPPFPIITSPTLSPVPPSNSSTPGSGKSPIPNIPPSPSKGSGSNSPNSSDENSEHNKGDRVKPIVIVAATASSVSLVVLACLFSLYCFKKRKDTKKTLGAFVVHPRDSADRDNNIVKIAISDNTDEALPSGTNPVVQNTHVIEDGNMIISVQILRNVTDNFAPQNELGRGGFGAVYKGELEDGTKLAIKRMESRVISNKALDEFQAEIAVLSKVRHRHLVSLLGYSVEGNERLLVYEYMPQGALSMHLFRWKDLNLEPLSWARRLIIGLDIARGMEYLHSLAHQSFIHRDLKSSNILLGDDFRAKVSDFGLVKLAPDRERSVATKLAGTFGYLAPEYAVTGKITTKADVFSFGVVLMELLTGLMALDEDRSEESRYLAEWFWKIKSSKETLIAAIDPTFDSNKEIFESIYVIAELAGHCTARDPNHRPDMGHAVNVLAQLVEKWKPFDKETEDFSGIDYNLPLSDMLKGWKESENKTFSSTNLQDSTGSIPTRPAGFAESFTSSDAR